MEALFFALLGWSGVAAGWPAQVSRSAGRPARARPVALAALSAPPAPSLGLEEAMVSRELAFEAKVDAISAHFADRPGSVALRMGEVSARLGGVAVSWAAGAPDRADRLRVVVSELGVVFVKLAQTLATRPDIIGDEAADALGELQDGNAQFDNALAMRTIADEFGRDPAHVAAEFVPLARLSAKLAEGGQRHARLGGGGEAAGAPLFAWLTAEPIAAASLAQVYRGETLDGQAVAVKVRRPRVVENVGLDYLVVRQLLGAGKAVGVLSEEADIAEMTAEVGAGLFRELDFRQEALNARRFAREHAEVLPDVVVPLPLDKLTSRSVLTSAFVDGRKLGDLGAAEQARMIKLGLDACFTQLMRTGFIHADPHYGNMLYTRADQLALLDFGLVTAVTVAQQEAMALAILHTLSRDWRALIADFRLLGLLPGQPALWVDRRTGRPASTLAPGRWERVDEGVFAAAFEAHLDRAAGAGKSFSEMTVALSALSMRYRFVLPSWIVFVIRAVVTLDGFAGGLPEPLSAVDEALPHAMRRALTPRTAAGRRTLRALCLKAGTDGEPRWDQLAIFSGEAATEAGEEHARGSSRPVRALSPAGTAAATQAKLGKAAREALALVLAPRAEGAALRRVARELSLGAVARRIGLDAWRAHVRMWRPTIAGLRARQQVLRGAAAACAQLAACARALAAHARGAWPGARARRAEEAPALRRRQRRLLWLIARAQLGLLGRSPRGLLALVALPPALLLLAAEAAALHCVAAAAQACRLLLRLQAGRVPLALLAGRLRRRFARGGRRSSSHHHQPLPAGG